MIFYFNGDGSFVDYIGSEVYQGSNSVNTVYFVGPFSSDCQVTAKFRLEDGEETTPQFFTFKKDVSEALFNAENQGVCVWEGQLKQCVTKVEGTVRVQFSVISLMDELTTETVSFNVQKGVKGTNIEITDEDVFQQILSIVSGIQSDYTNITKKLTKVSTSSVKPQAYIKEENGDQNMMNISEDGANELVKRKQDGNITAGTPSLGTDATSKAYVDDNFYTKNEVNTLLNSTPSQGQENDKIKDYQLIEKIVIGYNITTSEPLDWNLNYASYFVNNGTKKEPIYVNVSGNTTPTWEEGKYYYYDSNGISRLWRNKDVNGNNYSFKKIIFYYKLAKGIVSGNVYAYLYYGANYKLAVTIINIGNIQTSKNFVYQINGVEDEGDFFEIKKTTVSDLTSETNLYIRFNNKSDFGVTKEEKISQISILGSNSATIPAGSEIYIYGV